MRMTQITIDDQRIADFCRRHHIERLCLFGSVLRDDFRPESDVDVLVEFESGHTPGWDFFGMQDELSRIIGRQVDLNTPRFLSRYFRDEVLAGALPIYESQRDRGSVREDHGAGVGWVEPRFIEARPTEKGPRHSVGLTPRCGVRPTLQQASRTPSETPSPTTTP
jgi:predicted nucleotidyltransferase